MECIGPKHSKNRKRKRLNKNRRRNQRKFEVKLAKRRGNIRNYVSEESLLTTNCYTMTSESFWANYEVAQDWEHRHSVAWWKSRCIALNHENEILRNKIRDFASYFKSHETNHKNSETCTNFFNNEKIEDEPEEQENLEFQVDDEMMKFLEQSVRHKMELKRMREDQESNDDENNDVENESSEVQMSDRVEDAKLLYGSASRGIIAMETSIEANLDRHKDHAKPHYWPNIPLKP